MTLSEFISTYSTAEGHTQEYWAKQFGISRSYLAEILLGVKTPGRNAIQKIEKATNGRVPVSVWFETARK